MKRIECNNCGESVVLPKEPHRGEVVTEGETPREHLDRTGHSPNAPVTVVCDDCGNVWPYTGNADASTCPHCRGKRTEPVNTTSE
jgi:uncharacterized Zn finger protein